MNAFAVLGLEPRLTISEEELATAFRAAGKEAHPDAGGREGEFAALHDARAILQSPSRRLRHWFDLRGVQLEPRGTIDNALMDLFGVAGEATQRAETVGRKRDAARSALARAMLEAETQVAREAVEAALAKVNAAIEGACAGFSQIESAPDDRDHAAMIVRNLAFLEKWRAGLRAAYARLI